MEEPAEIWLCLSGGNALGAYHAGAYSVLYRAGIRPVRIAGTSVSAIVAAIIAGNNWDNRVARLDEFWEIATDDLAIANVASHWNGSKIAPSLGTLMQGRPPLFRPSAAVWWQRLFSFSSPSLFGRSGLRDELRRLVDFEHLNNGGVRLIINAVDVTTGQEQVHDSAKMTITVDHLIASSAFPVIFPPEEIDGHHMVDEGLAANLPVLPPFQEPPTRRVRCLAFDLASARGSNPESVDSAIHRMQDLLLSAQSAHSVEMLGWRSSQWQVGASLLHVAYNGHGEVGGKMLDFSAPSMKARRQAGEADAATALGWLHQRDDENDRLPSTMKDYSFALSS
ncbi:esterase (plasmid) [Rhizobium leguminosarum bv. trifolii CB782]|nr:esterase [Rhizobium leguminosarum bv. trifolii CB782]